MGKMGNFTVGETVWIKRGTLTSVGVSVRSAEDWVQVELRKKGGTTGQQKGVWLVAYGEEEVEMKKQQLKRRRPGDRQPSAHVHLQSCMMSKFTGIQLYR